MKVIVSPNPYRDKQFRYAQQAKTILEECGVEVRLCLPFELDNDFILPKNVHFDDLKSEVKTADMIICFGGDGTFLHASKIAMRNDIPILGVNIGTMGFIAELESGELELLRKIPTGEYSLEERSMLDVIVTGANGQQILHETALNDAVITKGAIARVIQISVECDGIEATAFSGDGVIISTPTGSTGYSMSAGGPIVEPMAKNLLITPICAHSIQARSIVIAPSRVIEIRQGKTGRHNAFLSVDGGRALRLNTDDRITCRVSDKVTKMVRLKDISFFEILHKKFIEKR